MQYGSYNFTFEMIDYLEVALWYEEAGSFGFLSRDRHNPLSHIEISCQAIVEH